MLLASSKKITKKHVGKKSDTANQHATNLNKGRMLGE